MLGGGGVVGDDRLRVARAVGGDVGEGFSDVGDLADVEDPGAVFGVPVGGGGGGGVDMLGGGGGGGAPKSV